MKIQIITNKFSGKGLTVDGELLRGILENAGHLVSIVDFCQPRTGSNHDLNVFCEVVVPEFFRYAPKQWWFPNIEWASQEYMQYVSTFDKVLCKTQDAYSVMSQYTKNAVYTGFIARDRYDSNVKKQRKFLHNYGNSICRNTGSVLTAWDTYKIAYPLIAVGDAYDDRERNIANVTHIRRLDDDKLSKLMNECSFVLLPSQYEGYGHGLNEARGCGAMVVSTDAPPMNEFPVGIYAPVTNYWDRCLARMSYVSPEGIASVVYKAAEMTDEQLKADEICGRVEFINRNEEFKERLLRLL